MTHAKKPNEAQRRIRSRKASVRKREVTVNLRRVQNRKPANMNQPNSKPSIERSFVSCKESKEVF